MNFDSEHKIRLLAFEWLKEQTVIHGEVLPESVLEKGMPYGSERISFMADQGIFKPRQLKYPLTFKTTVNSPYEDSKNAAGYILYKYKGDNPEHPHNSGLRECMIRRLPLIYFYAVAPAKYQPVWPVYIERDEPATLTFYVSVDEPQIRLFAETDYEKVAESGGEEIKRKYITAQVCRRLHQQRFREVVIQAYREQCAMCRLKHPKLLDASHITPDGEADGAAIIPNGISLCKLHHVAFDKCFLGIRPDYTIEVRNEILSESDGPMLLHGLQGIHNQKIVLPSSIINHPDQQRLKLRYEKFKAFVMN